MLLAWLRSFVFTQLVEIPCFVLVARRDVRLPRAALAAAAGTTLTHPVLWLLWPLVRVSGAGILAAELAVAIVETATFYALARPSRLSTAVAASFLANAASYGLGALLRDLHWLW